MLDYNQSEETHPINSIDPADYRPPCVYSCNPEGLSAGGLIDNNSITSQNHFGESESKIYETTIAPGSGASIEVVFPEEKKYLGNDHDMGHLLIGGGFVVLAANNSSIEH